MPYIGRGPAKSGAFRILDDFSASFDGSTTTFALTVNSTALTVGLPETLIIAVDGVIQEPGTGFTISGSNIVFGSAPQDSATFWGVELGDVGGIADNIVDGKITTAKLVDDAVTADKLANSINAEIAANTAKTGITSSQASAITANTAKVTNATHTGDVTGATALTIANGAVDIAHLSASGSAGSGTFLRGDNQWAAAGGGGDFYDTITNGTTKVYVDNNASSGFTLNNNYKFQINMPTSGEGFFFKCADQGSEHSALFYADYPSQITKIAGSSKWEGLNGGQTGSSGDGKFYVVCDANSRAIWIYNREGNNRTITVHGMGRIVSVTAQASI